LGRTRTRLSIKKKKQGKQSSRHKTETNIIGNEGITLEGDLAVAIHTEWLDADGRPFPADVGADFEKRVVIPQDWLKSPRTQPQIKMLYSKIPPTSFPYGQVSTS
jgi:hypothetical protein